MELSEFCLSFTPSALLFPLLLSCREVWLLCWLSMSFLAFLMLFNIACWCLVSSLSRA